MPKYTISDYAPSTFADVMGSYVATGRIIVWSGGTDKTIWIPELNYMFRAWHDMTHIKLNADFSLQGEIRACIDQQRQVMSDALKLAFEIEIVRQAEYFINTSEFISDQVSFFLKYFKL